MKRTLVTISLVLIISTVKGQRWTGEDWGVQIGISTSLGIHINQIGVKLQGYYRYEFIQFNAGNLFLLNSSNLADRRNYIENRINFGAVLLGGKRESTPTFILDGLNHQSSYNYGLAYNYLIYLDNAQSGQVSGGFGIHVRQFSLLLENDIFSGNGRDRFRTSYTQLNYHTEFLNLTFNTQLWTGETWGTELKTGDSVKYPAGYKDLRNTLYGRKSHGILSLGIDYYLFYGNSISALVGVDSERIRNGLQNRIMHNKPFVPKRLRDPNVNYPMLNLEGLPVHTKGEAKEAQLFLQIGLNRPTTF